MVINVNQTKSGYKIKFDISGIGGYNTGKLKLYGPEDKSWELKYKAPPFYWKIFSFWIAFGFKRRLNKFEILQNDQKKGMLSKLTYEKVKKR